MKPDWRAEVIAVILYAAILIRMDKTRGLRTAAGWYLRASHVARDISNWTGTAAIRWENAAKELVAP